MTMVHLVYYNISNNDKEDSTLSGILGQYKEKCFTDSEPKLHSQIGDSQLLILNRYSL